MYPSLPSNSAAKATLNLRFPCLHLPGARKRGTCYDLAQLQVGNGSQGFVLVWQVLTQPSYIPSLSLTAALTGKSNYKLNLEDRRK